MAEQKNIVNIIKCVLKQWVIAVLVAIIAAMLVGTGMSRIYSSHYKTQALLAAYMKEGYGSTSGNTYEASTMANTFQEIINNKLLQKRISAVLGVDSLPGTVTCSCIKNTNLITLTVTAESPADAMTTINGILDHYNEVADGLFASSVINVIEYPEVPTSVSNPYSEKSVMAKAALAGLAGAFALLFLYYYFRDDIKDQREVEDKLDTKLFGVIYHENKSKGFRLFHKRREGILVNDPVTSFGYIETFQKICTKIELKGKKDGRNTVLVTSVQENEGKSTIAANVAIMLAQRGHKVLLVDGDLRKPAQFKLFSLEYKSSVKQIGGVLSKKEKFGASVQKSVRTPGLYILAGNKAYSNSSSLINSEWSAKLFPLMSKKFDFVVIDTPPLSMVADAEDLMNYADMGLLVVRQNWSIVRDINDTVDVFNSTNCKLLGCVLNDADANSMSAVLSGHDSYYYRYGYGYGYGQNKESKSHYNKYDK